MRNVIAEAMDDLLQKNAKCNYVIVTNDDNVVLNDTYALDAYMEAYNISKNVEEVRCYMAPTGKLASNPVFEVTDHKMYLSGMFIRNTDRNNCINDFYSVYIQLVSKERQMSIPFKMSSFFGNSVHPFLEKQCITFWNGVQ